MEQRYASLAKDRLLNIQARVRQKSVAKILTFKNRVAGVDTNRDISGENFVLEVYTSPSLERTNGYIFRLTVGSGLTVQGADNHQLKVEITAAQANHRPDVYFWLLISQLEGLAWLNGDWEFISGKYDGVVETTEIIISENGEEVVIIIEDGGTSVDPDDFWKTSGTTELIDDVVIDGNNKSILFDNIESTDIETDFLNIYNAGGKVGISTVGDDTEGQIVMNAGSDSEGGSLTFRLNGPASNIIDTRTIKRGLTYGDDYSAGYTDRSLVDKAYVLANAGGSVAYLEVTQTGDYELVELTTEQKTLSGLFTKFTKITGNESNALIAPADFVLIGATDLSNGHINLVMQTYLFGVTYYSVTLSSLPAPPFVNARSLSVGAINQIPRTIDTPAQLFFSNGATDLDFSLGFDLKVSTYATRQSMFAMGRHVDLRGAYICSLLNNGKLNFALTSYDNPAAYIDVTIDAAISTNTWLRITITYDATTKARIIYVNSAAVAQTTGSSGSYTRLDAYDTDDELSIGGWLTSGAEFPATNALMDNFRIVGKKLSPTEVTEDYACFTDNTNPADLSFYSDVRFDARFESNLIDSSSNSYDMESTAPPTYSTDHS